MGVKDEQNQTGNSIQTRKHKLPQIGVECPSKLNNEQAM